MGTVTIGSDTEEVYGTLAAANSYANKTFGAVAAKWRGLTDDDKGRTLVDATRYLDLLELEDEDGNAIGHDTAIANVLAACFELAMLIASDPAVKSALDAGSNVKKLDADGASIEYFRPTSVATGTATRLPVVVQRLIAPYLPSANVAVALGGASSGTDAESWFDDCDDGDRNEPF